jgi:hypothetical protein
MIDGKPAFEMVPIYTDDPDFVDRLLEESAAFRDLLGDRHRESETGSASSIEDVRKRLTTEKQ